MTGHRAATGANREAGVATVTAAVLSLAVLMVLVTLFQLGNAVVTRHRAEGAADLAALAAAGGLLHGAPEPCARAEWVVRNMRASLRTCRTEGRDVRVEVRASPSGLDFLFTDARARAGPVQR